jgi:type IV secretion system protein TrbL
VACGVTDPLSCVTDLAGGAAKQIAGSAFSEIASDFGKAADSAINWLWGQTSAATSVTLGGSGWQTDLGITTALAVSIGLGLFVIQVIAAAVRREPGGLARAGRGLVVAFIAGGASIAITNLLLAASDAVSAGIVEVGTGTSIQGMGQQLLGATALSSISNPAIVMLVALGMIAATVVVWFALMIRKLLIIVAAVFAPVAFTGALSDFTSSWVRRWIETMIALIVSKIILVTIFVVGLGVLETGVGRGGQSGTAQAGQTITQVVVGVMILLMAGFAPWLAIKLVHFAGDSFHAIHASGSAVTQGAQTAIAAPQKLASMSQRASSRLSSTRSTQGGVSAGQKTPDTIGGQGPGTMSGSAPSAGNGASAGGGTTAAGAGAAAGGVAVAGAQLTKGAVDATNRKTADVAGAVATPSGAPTPTGSAAGSNGSASNRATRPPHPRPPT